jgi:hypothetical protein
MQVARHSCVRPQGGRIPKQFGSLVRLTSLHQTSLPLAEKVLPFVLAGSIPTEFGELINLTDLDLSYNGLTGMPPIVHFALLGTDQSPECGELINLQTTSR